MQSTEDLFIEGMKLLGKTADAKKAEAEAAKAASEAQPPAEAATPNQPVETEAHEVVESLPWYHPHHVMHHAPTIVVAALGLIGMIVVAKINKRHRKIKRPEPEQARVRRGEKRKGRRR